MGGYDIAPKNVVIFRLFSVFSSPNIQIFQGTNRLIFQPYTYEQIQAIVRSRLGPKYSSLLHEQALEYAAKKVANISGDLRKVIDFLRRGVEIALEQAENDQVCFEHVIFNKFSGKCSKI